MLAFDRRARAESPRLDAVRLSPRVLAVSGPDANAVAVEGDDGVILVDGGSAAWSDALLARVDAEFGSKPIRALVNTHWHPEQVGSNVALGSRGTEILAHENTKLWLGGDFFVEWEDRHYAPRPAAELPNKTFYSSGSIDFGGRRVEYWYVPRAHTDGDVAVFFGDANVLVASDLLSVGRYPVPDYATGGWIGGLVDGSKQLLDATDARTRIVAATGGVYGRAELAAQLEMCTAVRQQAAQAFRVGMSLADFVASNPTAAFDERWGDPRRFLPLVYKGGFAHLRELGGVI